LWIEEDIADCWYDRVDRTGRGKARVYDDSAIELCLVLKSLYRLPLRATQGLVSSLLKGFKLDLRCPDYSTISRRQKDLSVTLPRRCYGGSTDIVIDSTGLKVYGEGEWKVRQYGYSKRRTWRKLHLAVDPLSHEIVAEELTGNDCSDDQVLPGLLNQTKEEIERVFGDGAYDRQRSYGYCHAIGATLITPPRRGAILDPPGKEKPERATRNRAIERIETLTKTLGESEARKQWKVENDYHTRSLSETAMFRFKTILGPALSARNFDNQKTEAKIKCAILNRFTHLAMPKSYPIAA